MTNKFLKKVIGIAGGVGPYAGLEFNRKIFSATPAKTDQEHLEVILLSASATISDRTAYLLNPEKIENPGLGIFEVIKRLANIGAQLIAVPCNTAHSPKIWNVIKEKLQQSGLKGVQLIHMLEETFEHLKQHYPGIKRVGLLATKGTYYSKVYDQNAESSGFELIIPQAVMTERVHAAIYDCAYGIKAQSNPVTDKAKAELKFVANELIESGAQAVIMGCTEIPLALDGGEEELDVPLFDPMEITAKKLVALALSK